MLAQRVQQRQARIVNFQDTRRAIDGQLIVSTKIILRT